jgi:hypothetical protein
MKFKTHLDDYDGRTFELVPPGRYIAEIIEASPETATTGTPFLNLDFRILEPSHSGRHVWTRLFLTAKAGWRLTSLLNALGLSPADELDTTAFFDKPVEITVIVKKDLDGIERNEIRAYRKIKPSNAEVAIT